MDTGDILQTFSECANVIDNGLDAAIRAAVLLFTNLFQMSVSSTIRKSWTANFLAITPV
jgi:hypothetical protein